MDESPGWHLYILRCADGSLYTGITTDVARRVAEHNESDKGAKYTKSRRPVVLVYCRDALNKSEAFREEYRIKKLSRRQKEGLVSGFVFEEE
jgi:putative endonuclease